MNTRSSIHEKIVLSSQFKPSLIIIKISRDRVMSIFRIMKAKNIMHSNPRNFTQNSIEIAQQHFTILFLTIT